MRRRSSDSEKWISGSMGIEIEIESWGFDSLRIDSWMPYVDFWELSEEFWELGRSVLRSSNISKMDWYSGRRILTSFTSENLSFTYYSKFLYISSENRFLPIGYSDSALYDLNFQSILSGLAKKVLRKIGGSSINCFPLYITSWLNFSCAKAEPNDLNSFL